MNIVEAVQYIRTLWPKVEFDHRKFLTGFESHPDYSAHMTDDFRWRYAAFKYAVAKILEPRFIVEVGVRGGISALSFLSACPNSLYTGIDNNRDAIEHGIDFNSIARSHFAALDVRGDILTQDSQSMEKFPFADLCHIDGDHSFAGVRHDVVAAWRGGAHWILCDDTNDSATAAGIFTALSQDLDRGGVEWANFPDSWTGNILIHTENV